MATRPSKAAFADSSARLGGLLLATASLALGGVCSLASARQSTDPVFVFESSTGGGATDAFGRSMAGSDLRVAIGAPKRDGIGGTTPPADQGAVMVYRKLPDALYAWESIIFDPQGKANDQFGMAVGLTDTSLACGAPGIDVLVPALPLPNQLQAGGVTVFQFSGGFWVNPVRLLHPESRSNDLFGSALSITDELMHDLSLRSTLAVGAPTDDLPIVEGGQRIDGGSVTVFEKSGGDWQQSAFIAMPILAGETPASTAGAVFGTSLKLDGKYLFVGAKRASPTRLNQGAVFVFRRSTRTDPAPTILQSDPLWGEWVLVQRVVAVEPEVDDQFGTSLDSHFNLLVVGAPNRRVGSMTNAGGAFVFVRDDSTGTYVADGSLIATGAQSNDLLGMSVGVDGHRIMVGAPGVDLGAAGPGQIVNAGAAFLFASEDAQCDGWMQRTEYLAAPTAQVADAAFGSAVLMQPDSMEVSAPDAPGAGGIHQGVAFSYTIDVVGCPPDLSGDGLVDGADLSLLFSHWGGTQPGDAVADFTGEGLVNGQDLLYILVYWGLCGCDPGGSAP